MRMLINKQNILICISLFLLLCITNSNATIFDFTGFETGSGSESGGSTLNSISSTSPRTGTYKGISLVDEMAPGSVVIMNKRDAYGKAVNINITGPVYVTAYVYFVSLPGVGTKSSICGYLSTSIGTVFCGKFLVGDTGKIYVAQGATTVIDSSSATISTGSWYRMEFKLQSNNGSSCVYEAKVDDVSFVSGSAGNFGTYNIKNIHVGLNGSALSCWLDDISVNDVGYTGDSYVANLAIDGNGTETSWTGDYTSVEEIPYSSTDYVYTTTATNSESYTVADLSGTKTYLAVKGLWYTKDASAANTRSLYINSSSTYVYTTASYGTSYVYWCYLWETDPNTSASWTLSAINAIEIGVKKEASTGQNEFAAGSIQVLYSVPAAPASAAQIIIIG